MQEPQLLAPALEIRRRQLGDLTVAQGFGVVSPAHLAAAHRVGILGGGHVFRAPGPVAQRGHAFRADVIERGVVGTAQRRQLGRCVGGGCVLQWRRQILVSQRLQR